MIDTTPDACTVLVRTASTAGAGEAAPQAGADSVTGTSAPGAQLHAVEACGVRAGIVPPAGT
ncbi:hypothetical protein OG895_39360 [Streptomyces sp. NBC_00201]|uniref:hypothetical protein n=1 Tax=unclassified Streptomyces TaxID=2593676 RepID=UPI00225A9048|nr:MULTISPECIES: hypothetical protein [unclassified Streptomyces]MCX5251182.1 hypothetical protein [Streptomyces sp. NBC_00201]MCX5290889.1 hypothetical protein [Streptomyces sp. NBC_00183]